ncbi:hypothetical protein NDK47_03270 [Brevibacillus ruminantium]|uniref:Uncharacterized protein n=1 Tax=Brevibacillus ruminantium TaxID=2950604 RepID=A0ABY4WGT2_9BACL|nr:hypothetical protein [Brevibacillus ruminantium]USG66365.1 hypothetical protein NDK47_03270 [Brevibacillus ruminantium]
MWRRAFLSLLLMTLLCGQTAVYADQTEEIQGADEIAAEQVELFDTDKERVIQTYQNTTDFQQEAQSLLQSVSGRVMDLEPSLSHAMIVKIPLAPPQKLVHPQARIDAMIASVFVIMPKERGHRPWMILHTKEEETLVVECTGEVQKLRQLTKLREIPK